MQSIHSLFFSPIEQSIMARRPSRIQEVSEKNEVSCMWGLFSILESCQSRPSQKVISNGRPLNRHIIDYPRKLDPIASFDEECRKINNGAGLRSVPVDGKGRSVRNCIGEVMSIEKHKSKRDIVKRRQYAKMDAELLDRLVKTHKRTRKSSQEVYQSSSCCLNNVGRLMTELPSTSAEISLNKLTIAAILGAVCAQNHQEESKLSEYFQRNCYLGKYDQIDEINSQQVQMRAKAFVDQMFIDRKFLKEGRNSESKSFSNALEVLNSKKRLFMELLPDPNSMLARRIKDLNPSRTEKDTVKSILGANVSECEGIDAAGTSAKSGSTLVMHKGSVDDKLWQKIDYQLKSSPKTKFTAQPSDKIVIPKPVPRNAKHSGNVTCNCSSLQFPYRSDRRVSDVKTASFSFREIKKKLKHTFGVTKKEPSQLLCSSDKLSQDRSTPGVGSECICNGVDIRNSFDSSTNAGKKGKLSKNQELKSNRGSDIACVTDSTRRKLDFSSARHSNKQEFDVILEAGRHLSTRFNDLNSVEAVTSKKSPRTLERILSSPEPDFWPFSPRRDSLYFSGSAEMRFSPYHASPRVIECSSHVGNELRSNAEVALCDDHNKSLKTVDAKAYSLFPRTEAEARDSNISTADNKMINGESKIAEMNNFLPPELRVSGEVPSETSSASITRPSEKAQKCDGSVMHSELDSLPENDAVTSTLGDFPSTPSNSHHLDTAENIKYQEEHRSPDSVLEPFFVEDANSPPSITLQTARKQLQPRRLDFEECSVESSPHYPSASVDSCIEEDHLCQYVHLVLEASCLNWDQLSEIRCPPEELLHESLFHEVEPPPLDCYYDPKLLFDHVNEVLLEIYKCHFCSPPWLASSAAPKITSAPLAELVLDEILAEEAKFFLLPTTEKRTLEQLVSRDVANSRSWLDVRLDTEHIVIEISEAVMEESLVDTLLQFHT